jgi:hypothetical protein
MNYFRLGKNAAKFLFHFPPHLLFAVSGYFYWLFIGAQRGGGEEEGGPVDGDMEKYAHTGSYQPPLPELYGWTHGCGKTET